MNVKQEILDEVVDFSVRRTNTPTEHLDLSTTFPNGVCHEVADQVHENHKPTTTAHLDINEKKDPENNQEYGKNKEENEDDGDDNSKNDGDEECEMILGDIPDVTIPPVLQKYAALLRANSTIEGKSQRKRTATLPADGESTQITQGNECPVGQTTASGTSRRYACRKCSLIFSKLEFLEAHMARLHPVVGPFRCTECPFESKYYSMLLLHLKEPHPPDSRKGNVKLKKVKLAQRNRLPRMKCPLCTYEAGSLAQFTSHSRVTHRNAFEKEVYRNIYNNKHGCPFRPSCSFQAPDRDTLEEHYKTEHKQRLWHCPECDFYTVWKVALNRHIKAHRENPAYTCDNCGRKFPIKSYLSRHRATSCERVGESSVHTQPNDSVEDNVGSSSTVGDASSGKTLTEDILSSGQEVEPPSSASSSGNRRPRAHSPCHTDSNIPGLTPKIKNTVGTIGNPQLKPLSFIKTATHCTIKKATIRNADCPPWVTADTVVSHAPLLVAQRPVFHSLSITTNPDWYSTMRQDLFPLWNTSLSPKSIVEETLNALRNHSTMSPDSEIPSGSRDTSKDIEIIDLTDDSFSYGNDLCALTAASNSGGKTETCHEETSNLSHRQISLCGNSRLLSSCKAAPSSVTILWDSEKTTIVNPMNAKARDSTSLGTAHHAFTNSIKTTPSGQIRAIDGEYRLGNTIIHDQLDSTVRRKLSSSVFEEPSNLSIGSAENLRESSNNSTSCDTGFAGAVGPIIITNYREASPPPLVIDDEAISS